MHILLIIDLQVLKLIRQTPPFLDLLKTVLREATAPDEAIDDSDFEDESGEELLEEGNEVITLTKTALVLLKKLPTLEELEKIVDRKSNITGIKETGGEGSKVTAAVEEHIPKEHVQE